MVENSDITQRLMDFFYSPANISKGKILVVSKYTERTRVNICLLKYFLQDMNQKGIFISIDRPHQYTASLLEMHGISQKNLIYIDAVSRISGETESNVSNVKFINGPYEMNFLDDICSMSCTTGPIATQTLNLQDMDFVLIDDIAAITKYQEEEGIRLMLESYISSIEGMRKVIAPIVLDANQHKFIYEIISARCDRIVLVNLSKSLFRELQSGHSFNDEDLQVQNPLGMSVGNATPGGM